ncbi:uncharacterized protein ACBT44_004311 isoform 1-T7 [Syngnathus typhle]
MRTRGFYCPPGCDKEEHFVFGTMVYSAVRDCLTPPVDFLSVTAKTSDMWTELNNLVLPGTFVWSDRHKVTFTHWASVSASVNTLWLCYGRLEEDGSQCLAPKSTASCAKCPTEHFPIASSKPQVAS